MELIVAERSERFRVVNEVWDKLGDMQAELRKSASRPYSPQVTPIKAEPLGDPSRLAALESRLQETSSNASTAMQSLARLQQDIRRSDGALEDLDRKINDLKSTAFKAQQPATRVHGSPAVDMQGASGNAVESIRSALEFTKNRVDRLEERDDERQKSFLEIREMVTETYELLPMQAVKASRVALKAVKMSEREREQALKALDETEQSISSWRCSGPNVGCQV